MSVKYKMVYRVESRVKCVGPYNSQVGANRAWAAMTSELPEPYYDEGFPRGMFPLDESNVFGAPTKSAMKEWIVEPRVLRSHKYVVRKFRVPVDKVVSSKIQSIFKKKDAQCVAEYDIVEFMKGKKNA